MRIFFLGNNRLACDCMEWLRGQGEEVVGMALHPPGKRAHGDRLVAAAGLDPDRIFDGSRLREPQVREAIRALRPDVGLSVLWSYILKPEFLQLFPSGVVNLHPSYLPYNRGQYPNVWSIVEGTPAGVALHYMDAGVDTGDLIARRQVEVAAVDTGETLYRKLEEAGLELFRETWPRIREGTADRIPQSGEEGTYHRRADVDAIDEIDRDRMVRAGDLIDLLRARTFPPYPGAYFMEGGRRVNMRLTLRYDDEPEGEPGDGNPPTSQDR